MTVIDQVKLMALDYAMQSGLRYNDALWVTLNAPSSVYVISNQVLKTLQQAEQLDQFSLEYDLEYIEYHCKMSAAGMYPDWQYARLIEVAPEPLAKLLLEVKK